MNIQELKKIGIQKLTENNVEEVNIKVSILLQFVLGMSKSELLINDQKVVSESDKERYLGYITELIEGKPIQYITNCQEFMGLSFYVNENVLIPQPDTETLVEKAIESIEKFLERRQFVRLFSNRKDKLKEESKIGEQRTAGNFIRVLDLCTGSGAVAIAITHYFRKNGKKGKIKIYASDVSEGALKIAKMNEKQLIENDHNDEAKSISQDGETLMKADMFEDTGEQLIKRDMYEDVEIHFIKSNMFENIENKFDLIVSNPPYIETSEISNLSKEVQSEPHIALDGGKDGLEFYRIIAKEGRKYLREQGRILVEIGYNQKESVTKIFEDYHNVNCYKDLAGNNRVISVEKQVK